MQLTELSSNWKRLKQSLANDSPKALRDGNILHDTRPLKRRSSTPVSSVASQRSTKRRKTQSPREGSNMGAYISSLTSSTPTGNTTNLPSKPSPHPKTATIGSDPALKSSHSLSDKPAIGKYISLDCEMVGTTSLTPFSTLAHHQPPNQRDPEYSILARASIVSYTSATVYDAYVLPPPDVYITNYRTEYSGITVRHLDPTNPQTRPKPFAQVQREVAALLTGRVLVGHALKNDLAVLGLSHPAMDIRDTSRYPKYRQVAAAVGKGGKPGKGRTPSLKKLAGEVLGWQIQSTGRADGAHGAAGGVGHDSIEDARAAMALFRKEKAGFEAEVVKKFGRSSRLSGVQSKSMVTIEDTDGLGAEDIVEESPSEDERSDGAEIEDSAAAPATISTKPRKRKKKKKARTKR